jgi:hypothetical protein
VVEGGGGICMVIVDFTGGNEGESVDAPIGMYLVLPI